MSFCYNLVSCDISKYPNIENLCHPNIHPYEGKIVYINQVYNGNPVNNLETYILQSNGLNLCKCFDSVPQLRPTPFDVCITGYALWAFVNCVTGERRGFGFLNDPPTYINPDNTCGCWRRDGEDGAIEEIIEDNYTTYASCSDCIEAVSLSDTGCTTGERTLSYAVRVELPNDPPPDRGFDKCCYTNLVLADLDDTSEYKNDFNGFYYKRPTPNSTVTFVLVDTDTATEYNLNDDTYGLFQDFGGIQEDLSYFIIQWRKVLSLLGAGNYQIKKEISTVGISKDFLSNTFVLKPFSVNNADKTVRIDCVQNGLLVKDNIDFKGTDFATSLRVRGFFGRPEFSFEQDNLVKRDYDSQQLSMSVETEYQLQGINLPSCIIKELLNFIIFGNRLLISDYNKNNTYYDYELLEVELSNNDSTEYFTLKREANLNLLFTDRFKNNKKINC